VAGVAHGNPGLAGAAAEILDSRGKTLERVSKYLGIATSAQAAFQAVILGLEQARRWRPDSVRLLLENDAVRRQLTGKSRAHIPETIDLLARAEALLADQPDVVLPVPDPKVMSVAERLAILAVETRGRRLALD